MKINHFTLLITTVLIALFFFTGMEKVWYHSSFTISLGRQPLPGWMKELLEWGLPVAELVVVELLVFSRTRLLGLWAAALMMLAFAGYTLHAASAPHGYVPCACGKIFNTLSWGQHFWVNMGFAVLAALGIVLLQKNGKKNTAADNGPAAVQDIAQSPG